MTPKGYAMRTTLLICLAFALPSASLADCPSSKADLARGVYLTSDSAESIRYRSDPQGHVLVESFPMGDFAFSYLATTLFGIYQLQEGTAYQGETMPDSLARMTYALPTGNLPEPSPGLAFHSPVQVNDATEQPVMFVSVGLPRPVEFGACSYETLPVLARMISSTEDYIAKFDYIPSLGFAVEWAQGSFAESPALKTNLTLSLTAPEGMPPP
jgi:hypothetical protein